MPTNAEIVCLSEQIGSDRRTLETTLLDPFRTWAAAAQSHSITWSAAPGIDWIMARGAHQLRRHIAF